MKGRPSELELLLRRADGLAESEIVEVAQQAHDLWDQLPDDVKEAVKSHLRAMWDIRGSALYQVQLWIAGQILRSGLSVPIAVQQAGRVFNLVPRAARPRSPGMSTQQVRQYHGRQRQRGRIPGRAPIRRFRESEALLGLENFPLGPSGLH
jgi:hypothetical protein